MRAECAAHGSPEPELFYDSQTMRLEYIVVHELIHLRDPTHGPTFRTLMDKAMPSWRDARELLNRLPASHARWTY